MRTPSKAQLIPFVEGALYTVSLKSFHNLTTSPVVWRLRPQCAKDVFFPPLRGGATTDPLEVDHTGKGLRALAVASATKCCCRPVKLTRWTAGLIMTWRLVLRSMCSSPGNGSA